MEVLSNKRSFFAFFFVLYGFFSAFNGLLAPADKTGDFPSFYWVPKMTFEKSISSYDYKAVQQAANFSQQLIHPYYGPPMGLLLLAPLTVMPYDTARQFMLILNHLFLIGAIFIFLFGILKIDLKDPFVMVALIFVMLSGTVHINILLGQINTIILFLLCLGWMLMKDNRHPAIVAIPFAVACMLKLYPFIPMLYFLFARKYKILAWYAVFMLAGFLLSVAVLPAAVWPGWAQRAMETGFFTHEEVYNAGATNPGNVNIFAFTSRLFLKSNFVDTPFPSKFLSLAAPFFIVFGLMVTTAIPLLVGSGKKDFRIDEDAAISAVLLIMYMLPTGSGEVQIIFVLPAILLFLYRTGNSGSVLMFSTAIIAAVLISFPIPVWSPVFAKFPMSVFISTKLLIIFGVWCWMAKQLYAGLDLNAKI